MYMTIYELIRDLPDELLNLIAKFIGEEETKLSLIYHIDNNSALRLLDKKHYNYNYPFMFNNIMKKKIKKIKILLSMIRLKAEINFKNYIKHEGKENILKENEIKSKNKKYKNLFSFIKCNIIFYNSSKLLPYLLEIN